MKLSEIARRIECQMTGDPDIEISQVAGIDEAGPGDITFVSNRKYISRIKHTRASAIILGLDMPEASIPTLRTSNPYLAFARALSLFYVPPVPAPGLHPTASISDSARIGENASIGAFVVVGRECVIGANAVLYPHVVLYPNVQLGDNVVLHAHVVVREHCRIGNRVTVQGGAVIGSDGFGFAPAEDGTYHKIAQSGRVLVEDDVAIGANTTIDRAAVGDTIVRHGVKLDNLVQIGHGSQIGENSVLAAQVGVAGSTRIGRNVRAGGQVGFAGHLEVGDGAVVTAQSGTSHAIAAGAVVSGSPAIDNAVWLRSVATFPKLSNMLQRIRNLEKQVARLGVKNFGPSEK